MKLVNLTYLFHRGVALLQLRKPPNNYLVRDVRADLLRCLERATIEKAEAIVITGAGHSFSMGTDLMDIARGAHIASPSLIDVISALESMQVPTVAGLHGTVSGSALELALGCHWRVADSTAQISLPAVRMGLIPEAGATQRLPRLVGVSATLDLLCSGRHVNSAEALDMGLIDAMISANLNSEHSSEHQNGGSAGEGMEQLMRFALGEGAAKPMSMSGDVSKSIHINRTPLKQRVISQWTHSDISVGRPTACIFDKVVGQDGAYAEGEGDLDNFFASYHKQHFLTSSSFTPSSFSLPALPSKATLSPTAVNLKGKRAHAECFRCVQVSAKIKDFPAGLLFERTALKTLASNSEAKALQYVTFIEKKNDGLLSLLALNNDGGKGGEVHLPAVDVARAMLRVFQQRVFSLEKSGVTRQNIKDTLWEKLGWEVSNIILGNSNDDTRDEYAGDVRPMMGSDILANLMFPTINAGLSHLSSPSISSAYSSASTSCASPEEVDIVFLHSAEFGNFPRHCGGPLFWAEREVGLVDILVGLKAMHEAEKVTPTPTTGVDDTSNESSVFEPCTLLVQVVQSQSSLKEDLFFRNNSK